MPRRNPSGERLHKRLDGKVTVRRRKNVVQARWFVEMLQQTIWRYQKRVAGAGQVIEELIAQAN